jgi:hypothetical protein
MSQHDYNIANGTFPAVRTDINNALSAIQTTNSGTSRPTGAVAGQIWLDTTNSTSPTLKFFDGTDDISLATINYSANTVDWLDSTISITGLSTSATGTVVTISDTENKTSVNLIIDNQKEVRFRELTTNGTNYVGLKAPASLSADLTYTLPASAPTTNNQALISSTAGVMSFTPYAFPSADGVSGQALVTNGTGTLSFGASGSPTVNTYDTGTGATWSKPSSANWVQINIWGGGGSGGKGATNAPAGGGGGGAYNFYIVPFSYLVGAVTYTVGAGGASQTTASTVGNAGGVTSVTMANWNGTGTSKTIYAYGGGAGGFNAAGGNGGGGGGILSAGGSGGTTATGTLIQSNSLTAPSPSGGGFPSYYFAYSNPCPSGGASIPMVNPFGGGFGGGTFGWGGFGAAINANNFKATFWYPTYGGGGGGYAVDGVGTTDSDGGSSLYGGGGGGGAANSGTAGVGGSSQFGGNGSNGTIDTNVSSAGSVPAGGSGGTEGGNSGAGGSGRVQFIYW